jgi:hypothetical protein
MAPPLQVFGAHGRHQRGRFQQRDGPFFHWFCSLSDRKQGRPYKLPPLSVILPPGGLSHRFRRPLSGLDNGLNLILRVSGNGQHLPDRLADLPDGRVPDMGTYFVTQSGRLPL